VPFDVLLSVIAGFWFVLQHTPRAVMVDPPSLVIFPPLMTVVEVIADRSVVVSTGAKAKVVNVV